jgi:hypothetical protein
MNRRRVTFSRITYTLLRPTGRIAIDHQQRQVCCRHRRLDPFVLHRHRLRHVPCDDQSHAIIAAGDFCCPQSSTSHRDDVKLLRIKSFDCIRKMDGEKRCFDASPAIRKAIEPCRHVLAPLTGVFSCWEQTDAAPLPPLRLFQASELLEASTHGEAQTAFAMPLLSTYDTVDREVAESPWCTAPG